MKYYIVNTNRAADPTGYDEQMMLKEHIVSLYFEDFKEQINDIQIGDTVFLYSNKTGIVAFGEAIDETRVRDYRGQKKFEGQEFYKKLKNFAVLSKPISADEIKKITGANMSFIKAFFEVQGKHGKLILKNINDSNRLSVAS